MALFIIVSMLLCHVVACCWVIIPTFEDPINSWIYKNGFQDASVTHLYTAAIYFTITTITTVGYGDISPGTDLEMMFGTVIMCIGVVGFSFATGSLSSLISSLDTESAKFKEKLEILDNIKFEYGV